MYLKPRTRTKDGKTHTYYAVCESVRVSPTRVTQRQILHLGELNTTQLAAWQRTLEVLHEDGQRQQLRLFTDRHGPIPATPEEIGNGEDRLMDLHSPEVPASIRARVQAMAQPGDQLWRCPRLSAPRGALGLLGVGRRDAVIEWWLLDADGELIEAFWEV